MPLITEILTTTQKHELLIKLIMHTLLPHYRMVGVQSKFSPQFQSSLYEVFVYPREDIERVEQRVFFIDLEEKDVFYSMEWWTERLKQEFEKAFR